MKVLFIGGTGVISSSCSELCIERGIDLYLLNRGKSFRTPPKEAKVISGDIRNYDEVKLLLSKHSFDVVVDWIAYNEEQVRADYNLFRDKVDQFIFISSASAYHKPTLKLPITEDTPLYNPFWKYSQAKIDCENFLMKKYDEEKFPVTICRPSHTYDKTKVPLKSDFTFLNRIKHGKKIIMHDDGNSLWTLTHTLDFAKGFVGLIGNPKTIGEAYHITSDEALTWNTIAETLAQKIGVEPNIAHVPSGFITKYDEEWGVGLIGDKANNMVFDNSKIKNIAPEFKAVISFDQGAKEIVDWYFSNKDWQVVNHELDILMDKIIDDFESTK